MSRPESVLRPRITRSTRLTDRPSAWLATLALAAAAVLGAAPGYASAAVPAGLAASASVTTSLTLTSSRSLVSYGSAVTLTARLLSDSEPVAGENVQFLRRSAGSTALVSAGQAVTDDDGVARLQVVPASISWYQARHDETASGAAIDSSSERVVVRHAVTTRWGGSAAPVGSRLAVRGTVRPARTGTPVRVERYQSGRWQVVARTATTASGAYATSVTTRSTRGFSTYRVLAPSTTRLVSGTGPSLRLDSYTPHTYVVRTKGHITVSMSTFAAAAAATYADPRGWPAAHHRFARVAKGGSFTLVMSEARYLPSFSSVCSARYSCRAGRNVVINQDRWRSGSAPFTGTLTAYRQMVVNHETGHWLGMQHRYCSTRGALAPVMQQQSKGLQGCRPNAWPLPSELSAVD